MRGLCCSGRGFGVDHGRVLELEARIAVDKGGGGGGHAVVGAAPGHEVQLAGLACRPTLHEVIHQ
jgi:hypothetical protein